MRAKLIDPQGKEVPRTEYELELTEETFCFKFPEDSEDESSPGKKTLRKRSGRYKVVMSNDAGETEEEVNINFLSKFQIRASVSKICYSFFFSIFGLSS